MSFSIRQSALLALWGCTYRFFHLDLVDPDTMTVALERFVEHELVRVIHILARRQLAQHAHLTARQTLERAFQLRVLCA